MNISINEILNSLERKITHGEKVFQRQINDMLFPTEDAAYKRLKMKSE